jgi:thiamine-monophosphate kinase
MGERSLIAWLRERIGPARECLVGPGDDAAVLPVQGDAVVSVDAFLEGVHFPAGSDPARVGHKVIAASVSDIAAMGCAPVGCFVTLGWNRERDEAWARSLGEAMIAAAETYGAPLAGGDITSWSAPLAISVTVLGETRGLRPVLRSGARPGDRVFVTGELGGSLLGRHFEADPRVEAGLFLNREAGVRAMIDISDGLSTDLGHLCEESGVGALVRERAVPVSEAARRAANADGRTPLEHALHDGEDFELLFAVPPDAAGRLRAAWPFELPLTEIGEITDDGGMALERADGSREALTPQGYEHRWKNES